MPDMESPLQWNVEALWKELTPILPGISIEVLARTESTNTALLERVRSDARRESQAYGRRSHDMQPCLLVAEHQTQGRGRLGRNWISTAGGSLTFSIGLVMDMADWSGLSLAVGCAIAEALEPLATLDPEATPRLQLKWPNDIWLDGRKLGGILIETVPAGTQRMAVVGVGLNVSELAAPRDASPSQFGTGFASLDELSSGAEAETDSSPPAVLAQVAPALARALRDFPGTGFGAWRDAYARRDLTLDRAISAGPLEGIARGVDASGALLVETAAGVVQSVSGGEVSVRLASPKA